MQTLESQIESILFVSDKPITKKKIALLTGAKTEQVAAALAQLRDRFSADYGIVFIEHGDSVQFVTNPASADLIAPLLREDSVGELTRPALETLSVISYRGPVAKEHIEEIRGVNCSLALRNLLIRGLIEVADDARGEKKYTVTMQYLRHLGLSRISELPAYETLNHDEVAV